MKLSKREFTVPVTIQLNEEQYDEIKYEAFNAEMSISKWCREIIIEKLNELKENKNND